MSEMDVQTRRALEAIERRIERLDRGAPLPLVREGGGGRGGGGSFLVEPDPVSELPALPTEGIRFVALAGDTVYWATDGDAAAEDGRWHPLGGKFAKTDGTPGSSV